MNRNVNIEKILKTATALSIQEEAQSPVVVKSITTSSPKILLVEDDSSNVLIISTFLEDMGYCYDFARDGHEAQKKMKENEYSLILMDVNIPEIDGLTLTSELRERERMELKLPTPVVAMTAHALVEDRQKCLNAGMNDYISKPFSHAELQKKVEKNIVLACSSASKTFAE